VMRVWMGALLALAFFACRGHKHYPPPIYQKPTLPKWEPPPPEGDPLDTLDLSGEWVQEPPGMGGAGPSGGTEEAPDRAPKGVVPAEIGSRPGP
jgi:hypothetical protein